MEFEWDPKKAESNRAKHDVSFDEAMTVFADGAAAIFDDPKHSTIEQREIIIGNSTLNRLLLVSFTGRDNNVRIISARRANRHEREKHATKKTSSK